MAICIGSWVYTIHIYIHIFTVNGYPPMTNGHNGFTQNIFII